MPKRSPLALGYDVQIDPRFKELPSFPGYYVWSEALIFVSTLRKPHTVLTGYSRDTLGNRILVMRKEGKTYARGAKKLSREVL